MTDETIDPIVRQGVVEAVQRWAPGATVHDLRTLPGGHSGITLAARLQQLSGEATDVVIKMSPPGRRPVGRNDVLRQATVLAALATVEGVSVPTLVFASDGDPNLFAMGLVPGESAEPVLDGPDLTPVEVDRRARSAARMLARLHRSTVQLPLVSSEPVLSLAEELDRWLQTMDAVPAELRPRAGDLAELLKSSMPTDVAPVLVHGDYRIGNTLCEDGEVRAIIDWEIWSVGDPRVDLGWFFLFCDEGNFPAASTPAPGMPNAAELRAVYEAEAGVTINDSAWFEAFAQFKMAAIMGHNLSRHRDGRHHDPYQETLVPTILAMVERGLENLRAHMGRQPTGSNP